MSYVTENPNKKNDEDVSFIQAIVLQWKKIFDYKSVAARREFWYVIEFNITLGFISFFMFSKSYDLFVDAQVDNSVGRLVLYLGMLVLIYLVFAQIPLASLIVRRINRDGKYGLFAWIVVGIVFIVLLFMVAQTSLESSAVGNAATVAVVCDIFKLNC